MADQVKQTEPKEQKEVKEKPKTDKMSTKLAKIIEEVEKLSVLELNDLVKALEEKFGVSAVAAAPVTPAGNGAQSKAEAIPEQTVFNVVLADMGANKIAVIKSVREIVPTLGLQDAKLLVESAPKEVLTGVNKKQATEAKEKLEKAGAKVELK